MDTDRWQDDPEVRSAFKFMLRAHVDYQSGEHSDAPLLLFAGADYEECDGSMGLHADGKYANEPAIPYVRADQYIALLKALKEAGINPTNHTEVK